MALAKNKIMPPKCWYNKPELADISDSTLAMHIIYNFKQVPPRELMHTY